jgi:hypothetical protein
MKIPPLNGFAYDKIIVPSLNLEKNKGNKPKEKVIMRIIKKLKSLK